MNAGFALFAQTSAETVSSWPIFVLLISVGFIIFAITIDYYYIGPSGLFNITYFTPLP